MVAANTIMALLLYVGILNLGGFLAGNQLEKITALILLVSGGFVVYALMALFLGIADKADLRRIVGKDGSAT